jgi:hypothetical protein
MYKSIRVKKEQSEQFKVIAEERGMTIIGLVKYVLKALNEGRI